MRNFCEDGILLKDQGCGTAELFDEKADEIRASAKNEWERVSAALGMAEYDPRSDASVDDVIHRADKTMYENKRTHKEKSAAV